jgi:very-long-chain (3R)-3-hydroxyacyl-CoA dehydratase
MLRNKDAPAGAFGGMLTWLRYSLFAVLYPSGIIGEVGSLLAALPAVKETGIFSVALPNEWNFVWNHHTLLLVALVMYIPGSYVMYNHMLKQRKKYLSPKDKAKTT